MDATQITEIVAIILASMGIAHVKFRKLKGEIEKQARRTNTEIAFELQKLNGLVDALLEAIPYPAWVKLVSIEDGKTVLRMKYINSAYEQTFGKSRFAYHGRTDFDVWPPRTAAQYYATDMAVVGSNQPRIETVTLPHSDQEWTCETLPINRDKYRGIIGLMRPVGHEAQTTTEEDK